MNELKINELVGYLGRHIFQKLLFEHTHTHIITIALPGPGLKPSYHPNAQSDLNIGISAVRLTDTA